MVQAPEGITFEVPVPTRIVVRGIDKERVGQTAADIRALRKPEPYKGKGVKYAGEKLVLALGYSHPVEIDPPAGISFELETPTRLAVVGIDKELVGQMAAKIRATRKPEPYKGKGVRYAGEKVRRKAGKAGKIGGKK